MHPYQAFIKLYVEISDSDWDQILQHISQKIYKKNLLILEEGSVCRKLYFLESGLLRFFILNKGVEVTKFFTEAPYTFTSLVSFNSQTPALENIQALEDSVVWEMSFSSVNSLLELTSWNTFVRKLVQEVQYYTENILVEMQTKTAEERYNLMLKDNPQLIQQVQIQYLASYLGILPQSLSRIRKKMQKQNM